MSPLHSAGSLLVANIFGNILYLLVPLQSGEQMNFSFNTILFNAGVIFNSRLTASLNSLVRYAVRV